MSTPARGSTPERGRAPAGHAGVLGDGPGGAGRRGHPAGRVPAARPDGVPLAPGSGRCVGGLGGDRPRGGGVRRGGADLHRGRGPGRVGGGRGWVAGGGPPAHRPDRDDRQHDGPTGRRGLRRPRRATPDGPGAGRADRVGQRPGAAPRGHRTLEDPADGRPGPRTAHPDWPRSRPPSKPSPTASCPPTTTPWPPCPTSRSDCPDSSTTSPRCPAPKNAPFASPSPPSTQWKWPGLQRPRQQPDSPAPGSPFTPPKARR